MDTVCSQYIVIVKQDSLTILDNLELELELVVGKSVPHSGFGLWPHPAPDD